MNAALQLNLEQALAAYIASLNISGLTAQNIFSAHAKDKIPPDTNGTYLGLIAEVPDWEDGVNFAAVKVTIELATGGISDHDSAPALSVAHQTRIAAIIELFSDQSYAATKAAINVASGALQFIGWESDKNVQDVQSEDGAQLITRLPYVFDVFLTA